MLKNTFARAFAAASLAISSALAQSGSTTVINFLRLYRLMRRLESGDFRSYSRDLDSKYPLRTVRIFGMPFRSNPRFEMGIRKIESRDGGIREGQKAYFLNFSL